jgi:hypothetical protein
MMERLSSLCLGVSLLALAGCTSASPAAYHTVQDQADPPLVQPAEKPAELQPAVATADPETQAPAKPSDSSAQVATVQKVAPASQEIAVPAPASDSTSAAVAPPALPRPGGINLLVPNKEFKKEGAEGALRVSFDDLDLLKVLNMEPVPLDAAKHFPAWLTGLDGQKIRLRGWMYPTLEQTGLPGFLFVRDNQICCFGRMAKVYDKVLVSLREGETTDYIQGRPFDVIGTMAIQPEEIDGELMLIYSISDGHVIDK